MKITDIKLTPISYPMPFTLRWGYLSQDDVGGIVVEVSTDEGITGIGILNGSYAVLRSALEALFLPLLVGQNPLDVGRLWEDLFAASARHGVGRRGGAAILGAIDIALWDIVGKVAGLPIYRLLGAVRDSVPTYIAPSMKQPEVIAQECEAYKAAGYPAIKLRLGLGFVGLDDPKSVAKDIEIVSSARRVLGDDVEIGVDTDRTYDHFTALRMAPILEEQGIAWFEEPLNVRSREQYVQAMERLQGQVGVPLSGAQNFFSRYDFSDIVSRRAVDIVQPDVVKVGGISELMRVADLASVWGLKCMPHVNCGGGHDIQVLATAHCLAAMSNGMYLCYPAYDTPLRTDLLVEQPQVIDGQFALPQKPGLGIEINQEALREFTRDV